MPARMPTIDTPIDFGPDKAAPALAILPGLIDDEGLGMGVTPSVINLPPIGAP